MNRSKIIKLFYRFSFLEFFYNFEIVKRIYKRLFISFVPDHHYYIELVNRCNAECIFCSYVSLRDRGKVLMNMSDPVFDKAITLIKSQKRSSISLTPITGEVLMNQKWDCYVQKVLDIDFVKNVHFYTNAVLLNTQNRKKFLKMKNLHKISVSFSTGGFDRNTYKYMFGKDMFDIVVDNINEFLGSLKNNLITMPVSIDIKLPKNVFFSRSLGKKIYNKYNYKYSFIKVRHEFDALYGLVDDENIKKMRPIPVLKRQRPCSCLNDIRFAADGSIWLCGCVISELPGYHELRIGEVEHEVDLSGVMQKQKAIQREWFYNNNIPYNCRECTWYTADRSL